MTAVDSNLPTPDNKVTDIAPDHDGLELDGRGRRPRLLWVVLGGAVVVAVGVGAWLVVGDSSTDDDPADSGPAATATVERGTITATDSWDGTLDRGSPFTATSGRSGTVTRLADQGAAVAPGDVLFRIDEQPVTLLSGVVPMYRELAPGASGVDVEQLETSLAALGYGGFPLDDTYTTDTADAVRAWQESLGAAPTGIVGRGDVVFAPAGGQVDTLRSAVGDVVAPGRPILDITGTDQVVNLEVDVEDLDRFAVDTPVTVLLPTGGEVAGTVRSTAVVEPAADPMAENGGDTEPIVQVEIALGENAPNELVGAPVDVVVGVDERSNVLLVPVNALLALTEGGYGLEVVADDGTTSIVPVETGLFAEGKVEITSPDIAEGDIVGVAGR